MDMQVSDIGVHAYPKINSVSLWISKCLASVVMPTFVYYNFKSIYILKYMAKLLINEYDNGKVTLKLYF